jgi:hypothetical protein
MPKPARTGAPAISLALLVRSFFCSSVVALTTAVQLAVASWNERDSARWQVFHSGKCSSQ